MPLLQNFGFIGFFAVASSIWICGGGEVRVRFVRSHPCAMKLHKDGAPGPVTELTFLTFARIDYCC